jgi:hypothetical protein
MPLRFTDDVKALSISANASNFTHKDSPIEAIQKRQYAIAATTAEGVRNLEIR